LAVPPLISPAGLVEKWPPEGGRISLEQGLQLSLDPAGGFASPRRGIAEEVDHHVATGIVTESVVDAPEATQGIQVGDRPEVGGFPIAADLPSDVLQCAGFHSCLSWGGRSSLLIDKRTNPPEVCIDRSERFPRDPMHISGLFVRFTSSEGEIPPSRKAIMTNFPATYWLTDDVYDICDHGTNAATTTCWQCEEDVASLVWIDGELVEV